VQVDQDTTERFLIKKGEIQGYTLSAGLFILYSEYSIKTVGIGDMEVGMGKVTRNTNIIRQTP
jgi:hypothetical protein